MALVNITGTLFLPDGSVPVNEQFIVRRVNGQAFPVLTNSVLPYDVVMNTDSSGGVDIDLHGGEYVVLFGPHYKPAKYFFIYVPEDGRASVSIGETTPEDVTAGSISSYIAKRGDTILFACIYLNRFGIREGLSGISVEAAMRHKATGVKTFFDVTIVDVEEGRFDLEVDSTISSSLSLGDYAFDVKFSDGDFVKHTHTGTITINEEIT